MLTHRPSCGMPGLGVHALLFSQRRAPGPQRKSHPGLCADLLHLSELQLHRCRAAEDRDCNLEARALLVDLFDVSLERCERPIGDLDLLTDFERDGGLGPLDAVLSARPAPGYPAPR